MEVRECTKGALLIGGANLNLIQKLLQYVPSNPYLCHSCSILLITRATKEMIQSFEKKDWEIVNIKLYSILLLIIEGCLSVFKENLFILPDGDIGCHERDFERFGQCCKIIS
jgi:hypothetical protein